jgi:hypothetical protein
MVTEQGNELNVLKRLKQANHFVSYVIILIELCIVIFIFPALHAN